MYQRPYRASSSSSEAASRESTATHGSSSTAGGGGGTRRSAALFSGHTSWQSSHPYRRSPSAARNSTGNAPGACTRWARQRRASRTPGETSAPVGHAGKQRRHEPQPSATRVADTSRGASVTTDPKTNHEPLPGRSRLVFLPYQPRPARNAASRSTRALSSASTRLRHPLATSSAATAPSAARRGA